MKRKDVVCGSILGAALFFGGFVYGQNVDAKRHPLLADAQRFCDLAWEKLSAAQQQNDFDLAGHGAKAKDLLVQASKEIKLSAIASNDAQAARDKEKHK